MNLGPESTIVINTKMIIKLMFISSSSLLWPNFYYYVMYSNSIMHAAAYLWA